MSDSGATEVLPGKSLSYVMDYNARSVNIQNEKGDPGSYTYYWLYKETGAAPKSSEDVVISSGNNDDVRPETSDSGMEPRVFVLFNKGTTTLTVKKND